MFLMSSIEPLKVRYRDILACGYLNNCGVKSRCRLKSHFTSHYALVPHRGLSPVAMCNLYSTIHVPARKLAYNESIMFFNLETLEVPIPKAEVRVTQARGKVSKTVCGRQ